MKRSVVYFVIFFFVIILVFGCVTKKSVLADDIEQWMNKAQEYVDKANYLKAIDLLNQALIKFPNTETIALNYNIGFIYYKMHNKGESKKYLNKVINIFESNKFDETYIHENRKFIILAGLMLERIVNEAEQMKDPYHLKEDIEKYEKLRPRKKYTKPKIVK